MGFQVILLQWAIFLALLHSNSGRDKAQFSVERTIHNISRLENITQDQKDDQDQLTLNVHSPTEKHKTVSDNIVQAEIRHASGNVSKPSHILEDGVLLSSETNITTDIKNSTRKPEREEDYHEHEGKTVHHYLKEQHQQPLLKSPHLNSAADETPTITWSNKDDDGRTNTHKTMTGISENKTFIPQTFQIPKARMPDLPLNNKSIHDFKKHDFKEFTDLTAGMKDFIHLKGKNLLTTDISSPNPTTKMSENIDSYHMERTLKVQGNDMGHNRIVWYNTTTQIQSIILPKNSGKQAHITLSNNIEKTTTSVPEGPKESRYGLNKWLKSKITTDKDGPRQRQSARDSSKWEYHGTFKSRINKSEPFVRKVSGHLTQGNRIKRQTPEPFRCRCPSCKIPGNTDPARNAFNVMFNKPGRVSSIYPGRLGDCGMVNGIRYPKHEGPEGPNCINTGDSLPEFQFAEFNLLKVYTMNEMELTRRDKPDEYDIPRMRNTNILVDGEVCFSYPPYADTSFDSHLRDITHKISCYKPTSGQWVRVRRRKDYVRDGYWYHILICELVVWVCKEGFFGLPNKGCSRCPPENQCQYKACNNVFGCNQQVVMNSAIKKPVAVSSILHGSPGKVSDGVLKDPDPNKCMATDPAQDGLLNRWWGVDMLTTYKISGVNVTSRLDCCGDKLTNFHVFVQRWDVDVARIFPMHFLCATNSRGFSNGETRKLNCGREMIGRYVSVVAPHPNFLQLCEVQVFGFEVTDLMPGDDCTRITKSRNCAEMLVCDRGICKIPLGIRCQGTHKSFCLDHLVCDDTRCVRPLNEKCNGNSSQCQTSAICDSQGDKCKANIGSSCETSSDCKTGTSCDQSKKCKLPIMANCATQKNDCPFRSSCQSDNTCKWNPGEACESTASCQSGYVCDTLKKCKKPIGSACTQTTDCVSGASCQTSTCFCSGSGSSTCDPQSGRAGGPCSPTILCVTNSQCINSKCTCNSGYEIAEDFSCKLSLGSTCQQTSACVTGLVCSGSACRNDLGGVCNGNSDCKSGTVCNDGQCKLTPGSNCDQKKDLCGESSSCENKVCKLGLGTTCNQGSDQCKSGVKCSKTDSDTTAICRLDSGQDCSGDNNTLCAEGTVCEDEKICKLTPEGDCSSSRSTHCSKSTKCIAGKCKLAVGGECTADGQCETGSFCDTYLSQCRLQPGQPCAGAPPRDMCASGGMCDKKTSSCACSGNGTTVLNQGRCAPAPKRVGATCDAAAQGNTSCTDPSAQCVTDEAKGQAKCECMEGYYMERTTFACGIGTGSTCRDENKTVACVTGLVCDFSGTCGIDVGQPCTGENRRWCKVGSVCEEGTCKSDFKQDCSGENSKLCKTGTTCDTLNKCKFPVKSGCSSSAVCSAGAICVNAICECDPKTSVEQGSSCAPIQGTVQGACKGTSCDDPNAECNAKGICDCKPGFSVQSEDLSCKLSVNQTCADAGGSCTAGTICDPDKKICSLVLGESCGGDKEKSCLTGTACDKISRECKLDFKGNCSGADIIHCKSGTFCDWTGVCRLGTADLCNTTQDCITGAKCVKGACECETTEGSAYGDICAPKVGFVGGNCDDVGNCKAVGAQCKEGICRCEEGISTTETGFNCNTTASRSPDDKGGVAAAFLAALGTLAGGMAACSMLLFALLKRKKKRQDKVDQQMADIVGEREELAEAVEESIAIQEEAESSSVAEDEASSAVQGEGESH